MISSLYIYIYLIYIHISYIYISSLYIYIYTYTYKVLFECNSHREKSQNSSQILETLYMENWTSVLL